MTSSIIVTQAHYLVVVVEFFGMEKVDDIPKCHDPPPVSEKSSENKVGLYNSVFEILDKFGMGDINVIHKHRKESVYCVACFYAIVIKMKEKIYNTL